MSLDLIFALIFYSGILIFFFTHKKRFTIQNKFILFYKTKLGLNLMDKISKLFPRFLKLVGLIGIFVGFLGMIFIFVWLIKSFIGLIISPNSEPAISLVLPGIKVPGSSVFIPFWYGIISILIVATVHEFSHGVYARLYKIKVKSSGFALFGPILAAFVEPDDKVLEKRSKLKQLSVYSAGPFSNILLALFVILIISLVMNPIENSMMTKEGVRIFEIEKNYAADLAGLKTGDLIEKIGDKEVKTVEDFVEIMKWAKSGEKLWIKTNTSEYYTILSENPDSSEKGYLGVTVTSDKTNLKEGITKIFGNKIPFLIFYLHKLLVWIFLLSLGIGLVNLLPLGPIDGGKMFQVLMVSIFKEDKKSAKIWTYVSFISLSLIVMNLIFPYIRILINKLF